jgi:Leucine-rich repeat (LRR) protein
MNSNPLIELNSQIKNLEYLIILGISYTQIEEIPSSIIEMTDLK